MKIVFLLWTLCLCWTTLPAKKDTIFLDHPSFEGAPQHSTLPIGWRNTSNFEGESPPNIQPKRVFSVSRPALQGKTYPGMVARDNKTYEAVFQKLESPLRKGGCYAFRLSICRSERYTSISRLTNQPVNYNRPAVLRIWGANGAKRRGELLVETAPVDHSRWKDYSFELHPQETWRYLVLEVFYDTANGDMVAYNGNQLLDYALPISSCDSGEPQPAMPEAGEQFENSLPDTTGANKEGG